MFDVNTLDLSRTVYDSRFALMSVADKSSAIGNSYNKKQINSHPRKSSTHKRVS